MILKRKTSYLFALLMILGVSIIHMQASSEKYQDLDAVIEELRLQGFTEGEIVQDIIQLLRTKIVHKNESLMAHLKAFSKEHKKVLLAGGLGISGAALYMLLKDKDITHYFRQS